MSSEETNTKDRYLIGFLLGVLFTMPTGFCTGYFWNWHRGIGELFSVLLFICAVITIYCLFRYRTEN